MKYAVIIPAKNESLTIGDVIDAIATQTVPPLAIILMDDGSTDDTLSIVRGRQEKYPILECYSLEPSGEYSLGGHVASLFNRGVRILKQRNLEFDWIVKLDADLKFDADFIEKIANRIATKKIGIASGTPYYFEGKHKFYEYSPVWHTHGQFKIYSRQCYETIGGIPESLGWDTADNIIAITNGWETIAFSDINYMMHRKVGGKSSLTRGRINHGIGCFVLGYDTVYLSLKIVHDIFKPPYFIGALYFVKGYFMALVERPQKVLTRSQERKLRELLWSSFGARLKNMDFILLQKLFNRK